MSFIVLSLGALDLTEQSLATATYFVDRQQGDIAWRREQEFVPLRASSGARISYHNEGEGDLTLAVMSLGDTFDQAKAARAAIDTELIAALNGTLKTYSEQDENEGAARTYRIVGGEMQEVSEWPGKSWVSGFSNGRYIACAVVKLKLSKS